MPFLDDLGKRMTTSMDVGRLQSAINSEERLRQDLYTQIGERYIALHENDPEEGLAELVTAFRESKQRADEYRRLVRNMKGLVQCKNCGADIAPGVAFCTNCGARMPIMDRQGQGGGFCAHCGHPVPPGSKFCLHCGQAVVAASVAPPAAPFAPQPSAPVEAPAQNAVPAVDPIPAAPAPEPQTEEPSE